MSTEPDGAVAGAAAGRPFVEPAVLRPLALAPLIGALAFGYLGFRAGNPWLLLLGCAAGGPFVVSWIGRPRLESVIVTTMVAPRAGVGEPVEWVLTVRNDGRRTTPPLLVTDQVAGYDDEQVLVEALPPGGIARVGRRRVARRRGFAEGHLVTLATTAPFGMVERRRVLATRQLSVIHPTPGRPAGAVVRGAGGEHPASAPARTGPDVHSVREWRPGDDTRHVHWRSTARHGRLVVVEPERTVGPRFAVLVAGEPSSPGWEDLLRRVAGTVVEAARAGREVCLVARDPVVAEVLPLIPTDPSEELDGLGGRVTRDVGSLLEMLALLGAVKAPLGRDVRAVARWAGPGGDLLIATTRPLESGWWADAVTRAGTEQVRLSVLGLADGAVPGVVRA